MGDKKFRVVANVFDDQRYWGSYTLQEAGSKLLELKEAFQLSASEIWLEQAYQTLSDTRVVRSNSAGMGGQTR